MNESYIKQTVDGVSLHLPSFISVMLCFLVGFYVVPCLVCILSGECFI